MPICYNQSKQKSYLKGFSFLKSIRLFYAFLFFLPFFLFSCKTIQNQTETGFEQLFNGKNLEGWVGNKQSYRVDKGTLLVDPKGRGGGNLYTAREYSNFIFRFEFQLTPGANNGLGIHAPLEGDAAYQGKELQILDNTADKYKNLKPYQYHGSVYGIIPAKRGFLKPVGEWNEQEVTVRGSTIKIVLNGTTIVDGDFLEASQNGTIDGRDHPGLKRTKGHIGFLGHGDPLRFRNIRIKDLGEQLSTTNTENSAFAFNITGNEKTFNSAKIERKYFLYLPDDLPENAPLVFTLHGYGGTAGKMISFSKMNATADKNGFAVCYPQGNMGPDGKNSWNAGYSNDHIDDVQFLVELATYLQKKHGLNPQFTFATGMSNGADMCYKLACERPDIFAAIAPVAGCMMQTTFNTCNPSKGIPVFEIHGTKDDITLWEGDPDYNEKYGGYLGTQTIIDFWTAKNGSSKTIRDTLPDLIANDGSFVITEKHTGAWNNPEVWLYQLENGKHDWPGSQGNMDFQASETIWSFFEQVIQKKEQNRVNILEDFPRSTPEEQGLSSGKILEFVTQLEEKTDAAHSFMIIRHGKQIAQGWWDPYNAETPHIMHSLSKSFTATAIGFAIQEGMLSLDDPVHTFFPEFIPDSAGYQLKAMRIRDLLTMNTGHIEEPFVWGRKGDWVQTFLAAEVPLIPGTHFKYNSAATYMLSAIIQKVSGKKLVDFLEPRLFQPLGINKPEWDTCPNGRNTGGWGLHITTKDIAKLGQLYLQKGIWNGQQLIAADWVEMATSKQVSNGSDPNNDWNQGYGFQFWQCRYNCYRGDGAFGQFCIVMPEHDAVVAITSGVNDMGAVMNIVWEILLPAMQITALPPDPKQLQQLITKTGNLALKPIQGENTSSISESLSEKTFRFNENGAGLQSAVFKLHGNQPTIELQMAHGRELLSVGYQSYKKGNMQQLPFTNNMMKKIATSGAWTKPDEYQLRMYFYEMPARMNYTFKFTDNGLTWNSNIQHSLFGLRDIESLTGK